MLLDLLIVGYISYLDECAQLCRLFCSYFFLFELFEFDLNILLIWAKLIIYLRRDWHSESKMLVATSSTNSLVLRYWIFRPLICLGSFANSIESNANLLLNYNVLNDLLGTKNWFHLLQLWSTYHSVMLFRVNCIFRFGKLNILKRKILAPIK